MSTDILTHSNSSNSSNNPTPESPVTAGVRSIYDKSGELERKVHLFVIQLQFNLRHFPRHEKYALSSQILNKTYEMYNLITEVRKRYHKKTSMTELDITHEQVRMMLLLAWELGYFKYHDNRIDIKKRSESESFRRYFTLNERIDEIGRMIGGWIRSETSKGKD